MRIAIDIDSTLHHHWDVLSEVSMRRFGVELPYDQQLSWGTTRLRDDQFALCVGEEDGLVAASERASLRAAVEPLLGTARTARESQGEAPSATSAALGLGALVR